MGHKITYKALGAIETNIVARLSYEKKTIITAEDLDQLFNLSPEDRKQIVFRLKKKNILSPIKRGIYVFSPLEAGPEGMGIDELLVPPLFFPNNNYYIGYSTMFNYYGFTEQLFQTVYVLNTSKCMEKLICGLSYKFIKIPENRMYGIEIIKIGDKEVNISSKEKTMIDLMFFNKPVGGIIGATNIFREIVNSNNYNIKKLIEYTAYFPNITARKRIGLILDDIGVSENILKPLIESIKKTSVSSLNGSRKGIINKKWRVIVNDSQK